MVTEHDMDSSIPKDGMTEFAKQIMERRGLPGDLQREILTTTLPIFQKYRGMRKDHMSRDRILGLALEALKEAWIAAR